MLKPMLSGAALIACLPANAAVVVDRPPAGTLFGGFANSYTSEFRPRAVVRFTLNEATSLRGISWFTADRFANVGQAVALELYNDNNGSVGSLNVEKGVYLASTLPTAYLNAQTPDLSIVEARANFNAIDLAAGSYWIGLSGYSPSELGVYTFQEAGEPRMRPDQRILNYRSSSASNIYRVAYRLHDDGVGQEFDLNAVPEPSTWAMMIAGFALAGGAVRRSSRSGSVRLRIAR